MSPGREGAPSSGPAGRVIHTGQALVDLVVEVPGLPAPGGNVMASSVRTYAGGAVNVCVAATRQGARAVLAGAVGSGPYGDLVRAAAATDGVDLANRALPDDTGVCVVMVDPDGERTFVTTSGAERQVDAAMLDAARPVAGDLVCLTGYTLLSPGPRAALLTHLAGLDDAVVVVTDPGAPFDDIDAEARAAVLARTDVWTGNRSEAAALSGLGDPAAAAAEIARRLPRARHGAVVVRDGPAGCHVVADGVSRAVEGVPVDPVDTNGAGDAHTGVLLAARLRGLDWASAARRANAAAAVAVCRHGPATSPDAAVTDAVLGGRAPTDWSDGSSLA